MISKKIIISACMAATLFSSPFIYGASEVNAKDNNSVSLDYKTLNSKISDGMEVTKLDNLNFSGWLDDNRILHLKKVYNSPKGNSWEDRYVLNSYDIRNKTDNLISPKDTTMSIASNLSPNRQYIFLDTFGSANSNKKILDFKNKKVVDVNEKDADIGYTWVSDDTVFKDYMLKGEWTIEDLNNNVLYKGSIRKTEMPESSCIIIGTDLKKLGNAVFGKVYYMESIYDTTQKYPVTQKSVLYEFDVNTKKERKLFELEGSAHIQINNGNIYEWKSGNKSTNTPPLLKMLDTNGNTLKKYVLNTNILCTKTATFSPDGKYVAYVLYKHTDSEKNFFEGSNLLCIMNLETGEVKTAFESYGDINGVNNLIWNSSSNAIGFNYENNKSTSAYIANIK